MEIHYEVHSIDNAQGTGKSRQYVQLHSQPPMSGERLAEEIEKTCTLNRADVKAVWAALRQFMVSELTGGHRFHLPEIGYFSLDARCLPPGELPYGKITGKDIRLHGLRFQPEKKLMKEIGSGIRFKKSAFTSRSTKYEYDELWALLQDYFTSNRYITPRSMRITFQLSKYMAGKWLARFTADGRLVKDGSDRHPTYFPATDGK